MALGKGEQMKLPNISPSLLSVVELCETKAWFYKNTPRDSHQVKHQVYGDDVHRAIEDWIKERKLPERADLREALRIAMPHIDMTAQAEGWIQIDSDDPWRWTGRYDVRAYDEATQTVTVTDWKNTASKPPAKLAWLSDPAAVLYAKDALQKHPDAKHVRFKWVFLVRKGYTTVDAKPVCGSFTREQIEEAYQALRPRARYVLKVLAAPRSELAKNTGACLGKYGRCEYTALCLSGGMNVTDPNDLLALVNKLQGTPTPAPEPEPAPVVPNLLAGPSMPAPTQPAAPVLNYPTPPVNEPVPASPKTAEPSLSSNPAFVAAPVPVFEGKSSVTRAQAADAILVVLEFLFKR